PCRIGCCSQLLPTLAFFGVCVSSSSSLSTSSPALSPLILKLSPKLIQFASCDFLSFDFLW
uniref:Secreted protein n=1 Tax=Schistosoma curassoni TaxID=6186 RepID=A0A183JIK9_9TREM